MEVHDIEVASRGGADASTLEAAEVSYDEETVERSVALIGPLLWRTLKRHDEFVIVVRRGENGGG